jgi:hypothetical protein
MALALPRRLQPRGIGRPGDWASSDRALRREVRNTIHPSYAEGQGGAAQGIGWALNEASANAMGSATGLPMHDLPTSPHMVRPAIEVPG